MQAMQLLSPLTFPTESHPWGGASQIPWRWQARWASSGEQQGNCGRGGCYVHWWEGCHATEGGAKRGLRVSGCSLWSRPAAKSGFQHRDLRRIPTLDCCISFTLKAQKIRINAGGCQKRQPTKGCTELNKNLESLCDVFRLDHDAQCLSFSHQKASKISKGWENSVCKGLSQMFKGKK